ncbi:MAG: phage tail tape measure protein, partial [Sphingobacteriia bacterium]|nr:phage tail tape measure protein [Sphingobacteriia bacterium]
MSVGQLSVGIILSLIDRFTPELDRVQSRLGAWSTGLAKVGTVATGAGMALGAVGDRVLEPLKKVAGAAMAFESAMADVNKVVDFEAPDGLATMSAQLDRMTHTIPLAATGLASIAAEGGQLGIAAPDLTGYVEVVAKMSTAFDMLPQRAGESMAKLANVYNLPIAGIGSLGDAINHLSNNSAAKASEIVDVLARVGGVARGFGLTAVQAAALGNTFIALGKAPEVAGTAINALLLKLQAATRQSSEFRDGIEALGLTQKGVESAVARDAQGTLSDFLSRLAAVKSEARAGIMVDLFGLEYSDDMSALVGNLGQYHKALSLVGDESAYAGSMQAEFAARAATTENGMILLSNRVASVGRTLGAVMLPPLSEAADRIGLVVTRVGDWLQAHPRFTGGLVMGAAGLGVFAAALSPVLMSVGALAIGGAAALRGLTMLGPAAMAAGGGLKAGLMGAVGAVRALSLALFANPIGLAVLGIAGAALVIRKYWEPLSGFFSGLWSGLSEGLAPVGAAIGSALAPLAEMTQRWLAPLSGLLAPVGAWFAGAFAPVAGALAAPITALQNLWTWVTNILAPVQGVGGAAESMGHRWGMAIAGMIGKAAELVGAFSGLAGRFAQIGAEIVQGLIGGFVAKWGALKAKVSELAGGIVATAKGALGIKSPSTVF